MPQYDVIAVGGGLAGCALAKSLSEQGLNVLVLERTQVFQDRVRGEIVQSWGVPELQELGLYNGLLESCGHETPWVDLFLGSQQIAHRDLRTTTPQGAPFVTFGHPAMQQTVLEMAEAAGVEVRRGVRVAGVEPGRPARVHIDAGQGSPETVEARLVVGCDGRRSTTRKWAGFEVNQDPPAQMIAGLLVDGAAAPSEDTSHIVLDSQLGREIALFPQGNGRLRAYLCWQVGEDFRLQGERDVARFIDESVRTGAPADCFANATAAGPLATFDCADTWVDHPYKEGVTLVGAAAASNDPSYGQGLSLTLRDVRTLRDRLIESDDWDEAADAYASEHDRYYGVIHDSTRIVGKLFLEQGPKAEERRARVLPLLADDSTLLPDHTISGPDVAYDRGPISRLLGED